MEKISRSQSKDPVQESLRSKKDSWNSDASTLIAQLIAFKRGLNGRGDPRAGIPTSRIKDPLPSEVGSYLDQMASNFNTLIHEAQSIINDQQSYSSNRQKPRVE